MRIITLLSIIICTCVNLIGQVTITNLTTKSFTNLYIIDYDSTLKTDGFCDRITNKNLLTKPLDSRKKVTIPFKLNPVKYYNIICLDTIYEPHSYSSLTFKYHLSGKTKLILLDSTNVENDFWGHCTEGAADPEFEDFAININNKKNGNIIKFYFRFNENDKFVRYMYFSQWKPIVKGTEKQMTLYNVKPKNADKIYLKYYTEEEGKITENTVQSDIKQNQKVFNLEIQ